MIIEKYEETLKDGKTYSFRSLDTGDADAMYEIRILTAKETDFLLRYPEEIFRDLEERSLEAAMESSKDFFLGAFDGDKLVGSAHVFPVSRHKKFAHRCEIGILLARDYWSCGIAKKLMIDSMDRAREMGYTLMQLETFAQNERGMGLYEHLGFTKVGAMPGAALLKDGTSFDEVIMYKAL